MIACILLPPSSAPARVLAYAESCQRLSPWVSLRGSEAVFLEVEAGVARALALARRFGLGHARFAIGGDAATALALARHGGTERRLLPLEALHEYASPFREDPEVVKRVNGILPPLYSLGLKNLGDFLALPERTLASRFGREGAELGTRVRNPSRMMGERFIPPERLLESMSLEEADSLEILLFALKTLVGRVVSRLRARTERAASLGISLGLEKREGIPRTREIRIELATPQGSVLGLMPLIRERLYGDLGRMPLQAPVMELGLEVLERAPGYGSQRNFFSAREEEFETWDALLGRLSQKARPFVALPVDRWLPEQAWRPSLSLMDAIAASVDLEREAPRPSRVLKTPLCLGSLRPPRIVEWDGPERISGEWWSTPFTREYWRAETETGERLWIFESGGRWFLHGYFD